jgi:hypothetical protein
MTPAGDDAEEDEAMWGYLPLAGERSGGMTEARSA